MMRTGFQFSGQGSQYVGMCRSLHGTSPLARRLFARADEILGVPLTSLCLEGPESELRRTENAQPALFTCGAVACVLLRERGLTPMVVAGHSVGEYAALFAAESLSFRDGLRAVRRRGELMAAAAARTPGTMAAVIGLAPDIVEALCDAASATGVVTIANENGPTQTVVSGEIAAVERVMELTETHEGGVAVPLAVAGAFHSPLMAPVAAEMAAVLEETPIHPPHIAVVANFTADIVRTPAEIRDALVRQVAGRVRWGASIARMAAAGAERLIEAGPGRTLTRLARTLAPELSAVASEDLFVGSIEAGST